MNSVIAVCFRHKHLLPCGVCEIQKNGVVIWDARIAARAAKEVRRELERATREPSV